VVVLFKLFAKTEKITMEDSRKANGMLKYRLHLPVVLQHCVEALQHYPHKPVLFAGLVLTLLWTAECW
jgi:hypothetical protein